ncbi:MAG TPA: MerR family transcriptional regulator [Burkholderiales bacterium]|nr:MerR family transcriptional regulator [Burkholderiales bacterium]
MNSLPIRTVSALTGVNAITLRAWERRYGLIRPLRTAKGHRLYSQAQVEQIQRVLALTRSGVSIGQVKAALQAQAREAPAEAARAREPWTAYRKRMAAAVAAFDEAALEEAYAEALSLHPIDRVTRMLLMPLLEELGERWSKVAGGVAEEHFFSTYLRNKLGARFHHRRALAEGPKVLAACVPGEHHEVGLLLFALAAHEAGLRVVLLGANVPLAEAGAAARRAQCDAVVLASAVAPVEGFLAELATLCRSLRRPVFVGGATAAASAGELQAAGAVPLAGTIDEAVRRIGAALREKRR